MIQVPKCGPVAIAQKFTVLQIQGHQVFHLKQVGYKSRTAWCIIAQILFWIELKYLWTYNFSH